MKVIIKAKKPQVQIGAGYSKNIIESNYKLLENKPKINNVELIGNKSLAELGIQEKEAGKGLSTNDLTNELKASYDETVQKAQNNEEELQNKVDKVNGKGLSEKEFTAQYETKLQGIEENAEVNKIDTVKVNGTALNITNKEVDVTVPTRTSQITNDSNFAVDGNYVHTDNNFTIALKNKLDGIAPGATNITVDTELNSTSMNPVQNKKIKEELDKKANITDVNTALDNKVNTEDMNTELAKKANTLELKEKIETKDLYINNVKVIWSD